MLTITSAINDQFRFLHESSLAFIRNLPEELLYKKPDYAQVEYQPGSIGEALLRSAATAEQTFGGITTNLWDDPFEWTLPESLPSRADVESYLNEVDRARERAFAAVADDADLSREIGVPAGGTMPLASVLLQAMGKAFHQQGMAFQMLRFDGEHLPHFTQHLRTLGNV